MSKSEAELEKSVSLMDQIQALIAPPTSRTGSDGKGEGLEERHPYYRRPGQGHNHDCCDACGEGGNLLCCDLCPASFHLTCHDPPLVEADIPSGLWSCHQCQYLAKKSKEKDNFKCSGSKGATSKYRAKIPECKTPVSRRTSRASSIDSAGSSQAKLKRTNFTESEFDAQSRAIMESLELSTKQSTSSSMAGGSDEYDSEDESLDEELIFSTDNPMQALIDAAAQLNPTQFELPRDMSVPINFPGSDKPFCPKKVSSAHLVVGKKAEDQHVSEDGIVPEPVRFCFECGKTCRYAPLIACDYCPLFYHLDCLDPPLTYFPASRWMCPAHPEHFIDSSLLKSTSVTERVRLWQRFNRPFDHHTVTLEFYRKTHLRNVMHPIGPPILNNNSINVPESVKALYRNPPPALPTLKTHVREEKFRRNNRNHFTSNLKNENCSNGPTENEKEQWLLGLLSFQSELANYLAKDKSTKPPSPNTTEPCEKNQSNEEASKTETAIKTESEVKSADENCTNKHSVANGDTLDTLKTEVPHPLCNGDVVSSKKSNHLTQLGNDASSKKSNVEEKSDTAAISDKVPRHSSQCNVSISGVDSLLNSVNELGKLTTSVLSTADSCKLLESLDPRLVHLLACQQLQKLTDSVRTSQLAFDKSLNDSEEEWKVSTKARATISPLSLLSAPSVPMVLRTLTIGTDSCADLCLKNYGHCDFVSSKHAAIFFDEGSLHYELLNYSEHGTTVDNVLYSCDTSNRPRPRVNTRSRSNKEGIKVKRPVYKYADDSDSEEEIKLDPFGGRTPKWMRCKCYEDDPSSGSESEGEEVTSGKNHGWEGSALLNHGSQISFGCLKFIFSISEFAPSLYIKEHNSVKDFLSDCKVIHSSRMTVKDQQAKKKRRSASISSSSSSSSSTLSHTSKMEVDSDESCDE
nr:PREDICTED: PHD finger protein 12 isoform X1 [Bemisia tabaci]